MAVIYILVIYCFQPLEASFIRTRVRVGKARLLPLTLHRCMSFSEARKTAAFFVRDFLDESRLWEVGYGSLNETSGSGVSALISEI